MKKLTKIYWRAYLILLLLTSCGKILLDKEKKVNIRARQYWEIEMAGRIIIYTFVAFVLWIIIRIFTSIFGTSKSEKQLEELKKIREILEQTKEKDKCHN